MKQICRKLVIAICLGILLVGPAVSVSANNSSDSGFSFYFSNYYQTTGERYKQDDSSSYMYCTSTSHPYYASVYGTYSIGGSKYNCSYGNTYTFRSGTQRYLVNSVNENGYPYAGIMATRENGYIYSASGLWSPDSV